MPTKRLLKKYLIHAIVASLVVSALVGILIMLLGSFGDIQGRILATTLTVAIFSVTCLASLRNLESERLYYRQFAWLGIAFSLAAVALAQGLIWVDFEFVPWKWAIVSTILAFSTAHASLLLPARSASALLNALAVATLVCIAIVAGFLIYLVTLVNDSPGDFFFRLLGVFAILDVLGTITTPILARVTSSKAS